MNRVILDGFPEYWPDEIHLSTCARAIRRLRFRSMASAKRELLGDPGLYAVVDLPSRLDYVAARIPASYGYTSDFIIDHGTLEPYNSPFRTPKDVEHLRDAMKSLSGTGIHMYAGLANSSVSRPKFL